MAALASGRGTDRFERDDEPFEEDPVQSDWNGSAKVALISVERSETAWQTIAAPSWAFPRAKEFVRPGFDEPWR
jgi:hypothetical protein